jgi:hypothetical protein
MWFHLFSLMTRERERADGEEEERRRKCRRCQAVSVPPREDYHRGKYAPGSENRDDIPTPATLIMQEWTVVVVATAQREECLCIPPLCLSIEPPLRSVRIPSVAPDVTLPSFRIFHRNSCIRPEPQIYTKKGRKTLFSPHPITHPFDHQIITLQSYSKHSRIRCSHTRLDSVVDCELPYLTYI